MSAPVPGPCIIPIAPHAAALLAGGRPAHCSAAPRLSTGISCGAREVPPLRLLAPRRAGARGVIPGSRPGASPPSPSPTSESAPPLRVWGPAQRMCLIGGGTPAWFSPDGLDELSQPLRARSRPDGRDHLANPGTVDAGRLPSPGRRQPPVGGHPEFLTNTTSGPWRIHGRADAIAAAEAALTHFEAVNLDLMYALPGQTLAEAGSRPRHRPRPAPATCPATTSPLEPNTAFAANPPQVLRPRRLRRHAGRHRGSPRRRRLPPLRTLRLPSPAASAATTSTTGLRRPPRHRRRRPRQLSSHEGHPSRDPPQSTRRLPRRPPERPVRAERRKRRR